MAKFRITYKDPDTGDLDDNLRAHECEFYTTVEPNGLVIRDIEWAEDLAYSLAKKGWYQVDRI